MGCASSNLRIDDCRANRVREPAPWKHAGHKIFSIELRATRDSFWRMAPLRDGGRPDIWEALKDAAECHHYLDYKQGILDMHNIRLGNPGMTVCYDDTGNTYKLPFYVLSDPTDLNRASGNVIRRFLHGR